MKEYELNPHFIRRKTDNLFGIIMIVFLLIVIYSKILSAIFSFLFILILLCLYRFLILKIIKANTHIQLLEDKIILKSLLVNEIINISDIKIVGYINRLEDTGDFIINLNGFRMGSIYWNNLIQSHNFIMKKHNKNTIIIPDVKNVQRLFKEINILIGEEKIRKKDFVYQDSKLNIMENSFIISNEKSKLKFLKKEYLCIKNQKNCVEINDLGINKISCSNFGLPSLCYEINRYR